MVETSMREALGKSALKLESHEAELAGVGKGFVCNVVRLRSLVWTGDEGLAPTELILKVPTTQNIAKLFNEIITEESDETTKSVMSEDGMQLLIPIAHNKVYCHRFYCHLHCHRSMQALSRNAKCMTCLQRHHPASAFPKSTKRARFPRAQLVSCNQFVNRIFKILWSETFPGFILMEDLSDDFLLGDMVTGFNVEQLEQITDFLADLTVYSIKNKGSVSISLCFSHRPLFQRYKWCRGVGWLRGSAGRPSGEDHESIRGHDEGLLHGSQCHD